MYIRLIFLVALVCIAPLLLMSDEVEVDSTGTKKPTVVNHIFNQAKRSNQDTIYLKYSDVSIEFVGDNLKSISWGRNIWSFSSGGVKREKLTSRTFHKFNGHWAGIAVSLNGYMSGAFDIKMPTNYDFMKLNYGKSAGVYLNLFEVNVTLARFKHGFFGMFTGLGYEFHNYRLDKNVMIDAHGGMLSGYKTQDAYGNSVMRKSKLEVEYVTAPLIFEYQYIGRRKVNDFHIGAGVVLGITTFSHTKVKFNDSYTNYDIVDYETGRIVDNRTTGKDLIYKNRYLGLTPFKCDAIVTVGFAGLNFFVTHSVTNMFKGETGLKLYPWSAGIILMGW